MWGDNTMKKRNKANKCKKKKDRERELSTSSFTSADLSTAIQGEEYALVYIILLLHNMNCKFQTW